MIAKVRKGAGFGGVLRYLYGPGAREEHQDPHRVGGTVIGDDPRSLAQELRASAQLNERVTKPVAHYPLALPQGEHLSDEQWGQAAHVFMEHMGYIERGSDGFAAQDAPYVVVRHGDDHAHVVASRVRNDGQVVRDSFDYQRSHQAARAVEDRFGLSRPPERGGQLAQVTRSERESAQRRQVAPERDRLRQALETARDQCDGTRAGFERQAAQNGVLLRANEASTGRMNGYSASLQGWTDQEGEQIWMPYQQGPPPTALEPARPGPRRAPPRDPRQQCAQRAPKGGARLTARRDGPCRVRGPLHRVQRRGRRAAPLAGRQLPRAARPQ